MGATNAHSGVHFTYQKMQMLGENKQWNVVVKRLASAVTLQNETLLSVAKFNPVMSEHDEQRKKEIEHEVMRSLDKDELIRAFSALWHRRVKFYSESHFSRNKVRIENRTLFTAYFTQCV